MEKGLKISQKERTKTTNALLISLMSQLEKSVGSITEFADRSFIPRRSNRSEDACGECFGGGQDADGKQGYSDCSRGGGYRVWVALVVFVCRDLVSFCAFHGDHVWAHAWVDVAWIG
ncbi:hypothetical protein DsansV1_C38g0235231 [Dioscorea sansibarensis]